jgi:hypothetical protein
MPFKDIREFIAKLENSAEVQGARGVFANVFGAQCEEDREENAPGHTHFTWEV